MDTRSYYDFAENDYQFLMAAVNEGHARGNLVCAISQNICEKYLKDIVDRYCEPQNEAEESEKMRVLKTHSLRKLENYVELKTGLQLSDETRDIVEQADGFYFSTRYPGDESIEATERDMRRCLEAVEETRELHEELGQYLEREQSLKEEKNKDIGPGY